MRLIVLAAVALTPLLAMDNKPGKRLNEAAAVFSEVMATPDKGIPQDLLERAHCIVIVPGVKTAAFIFGGKYGKGYLSCRNQSGAGWSAPGTVRIEGGSVGFQIGGSHDGPDHAGDVGTRSGQAAFQQVHSGRGRLSRGRPRGTHGDSSNGRADAR